MKKLITALALTAAAAGCADTQSTQSDCAAAEAHLQACMPGEQVVAPDACDADMAATVLDSSCDELMASAETAGKADGCNPWFWWTCTGSSADDTTGRDTNEPTEPREPGMVCGADARDGDFETWRNGDVEDIAYGDGWAFAALTD